MNKDSLEEGRVYEVQTAGITLLRGGPSDYVFLREKENDYLFLKLPGVCAKMDEEKGIESLILKSGSFIFDDSKIIVHNLSQVIIGTYDLNTEKERVLYIRAREERIYRITKEGLIEA